MKRLVNTSKSEMWARLGLRNVSTCVCPENRITRHFGGTAGVATPNRRRSFQACRYR